jgi:hypothetical protein
MMTPYVPVRHVVVSLPPGVDLFTCVKPTTLVGLTRHGIGVLRRRVIGAQMDSSGRLMLI